MRIVGGMHGGRKIKSLRGMTTRPTSEMVREALFNILNRRIAGCRFLDAYAGTGAVGLEALSRGADFAVFIERDHTACKVIGENLKALNLTDKAAVLCSKTVETMKKLEKKIDPFDIVFLDPPYYKNEIALCLEFLRYSGILKPDSLVVVQHEADNFFGYSGFDNIKQKKYGKTIMSFLIKEEKS